MGYAALADDDLLEEIYASEAGPEEDEGLGEDDEEGEGGLEPDEMQQP